MCLCIEDNMAFYHLAIPYTYAFFFFFFILFVVFILLLLLTTEPYPRGDRDPEEKCYYDPNSNSKKMFSSLDEKASVHLSVVIPAYNEEERLPPMLDEMINYLESRVKTFPQFKYEAIIVSDGSKDKTIEVSHSYCKKYGHEKIKCLELLKNRGKGGAVRLGIQSARGAIILFADADGATKFDDLSKLEDSLQNIVSANYFNNMKAVEDELAIVIGSRAHLEKESLSSRSLFRTILMYGFHFLVWLFTVRSIKDTQCGFKLFTRKAAQICFKNLHVERWAFDVELLYVAEILAIPISEISVNWTEIDGSKVTPVWSWIQMGCDLETVKYLRAEDADKTFQELDTALEPDLITQTIEENVRLADLDLEVDNENISELWESHCEEPTVTRLWKWENKMLLKNLKTVRQKLMIITRLTEGLHLIENGLQILEEIDVNDKRVTSTKT